MKAHLTNDPTPSKTAKTDHKKAANTLADMPKNMPGLPNGPMTKCKGM